MNRGWVYDINSYGRVMKWSFSVEIEEFENITKCQYIFVIDDGIKCPKSYIIS